LDPAQIKSYPARGDYADIEAAARAYERELADAAPEGRDYPRFDITFLGVGPDGHIASLFPEHASLHESERMVIAETDSPKPPPERLSLTLPVINSSDRVWLVLAGSDKASALGLALAGASVDDVPAAGAQGRKRTVFFVDQAAAAEVPENLIAPSYYWTSADDAEQ
jgi:6-phosphogluconolactonase